MRVDEPLLPICKKAVRRRRLTFAGRVHSPLLCHTHVRPLVCTAIIESYGIRHTWWFLVTQFYIPAFMLLFVNSKSQPCMCGLHARHIKDFSTHMLPIRTKTDTFVNVRISSSIQIVEKGRQEAVDFHNNEQEEKRIKLEKEGLAAASDMELSDAKFLEATKDA